MGGGDEIVIVWRGGMAGVGGIAGGLLKTTDGDLAWRASFVLGLVAGAGAFGLVSPETVTVRIEASLPMLVIGGVLVGFGTRLGGGCTSGHGVCGIARLSRRSLLATMVFMSSAVATVYVIRHLIGD